MELDLERSRVDLGQHLALADGLTLAEQNLDQPTVHLGAHRHRLVRHHAADAFQKDRHVATDNRGRQHRHRARPTRLDSRA